jgi:hypothetical protein
MGKYFTKYGYVKFNLDYVIKRWEYLKLDEQMKEINDAYLFSTPIKKKEYVWFDCYWKQILLKLKNVIMMHTEIMVIIIMYSWMNLTKY